MQRLIDNHMEQGYTRTRLAARPEFLLSPPKRPRPRLSGDSRRMAEYIRSDVQELPYASLSDEELMARLVLRDTRALETLYDRHARALYSLSIRLLGDRAVAEEVVQECLLKLWRAPERYQAERGRPLTWLLGVVHHRAVDELRRRRSERRALEVSQNGQLPPTASADDPEQRVWLNLESEALARALDTLPAAQRQVLHLAYYEGMTQADIARYLDEPLGTVKTRVRLAMQKLRSMTLVSDG